MKKLILFPFFRKISPFFLSQYNWALVEQFIKTKDNKYCQQKQKVNKKYGQKKKNK